MESRGDLPVEPGRASPISVRSETMPSLEPIDEDLVLKTRISSLEESIVKLTSLIAKPKSSQKKSKRVSGNRTRAIYGDDFDSSKESGTDSCPDVIYSSGSDSDTSVSSRPPKSEVKRKSRESIMYKLQSKDRDSQREAHLRTVVGSSIVLPQKFHYPLIEAPTFVNYRSLVKAAGEHEANPHNHALFLFRYFAPKARAKILNALKLYHGNPRSKKYDAKMLPKAPTERELDLMLAPEFCLAFERMLRPQDQQHYENIFRSVVASHKNQRISNSIMSYNSFSIDVDDLFLLMHDLVSVLGEVDPHGKLVDHYPTLRPNKAYDLEGLVPLLTVAWPTGVLLEIRKKIGISEPKIKLITEWMSAARKVVDGYRTTLDQWSKLMGAFSGAEKAEKRTQLSALSQGDFTNSPDSGEDPISEKDLQDQSSYQPQTGDDYAPVDNEYERQQDNFAAFTRPSAMPINIPTKSKEYSTTSFKLPIKNDLTRDPSKLACWGEVQGKGNCKREDCPFSHDRTLLNNLAKSIILAMEARDKAVSFSNIQSVLRDN